MNSIVFIFGQSQCGPIQKQVEFLISDLKCAVRHPTLLFSYGFFLRQLLFTKLPQTDSSEKDKIKD